LPWANNNVATPHSNVIYQIQASSSLLLQIVNNLVYSDVSSSSARTATGDGRTLGQDPRSPSPASSPDTSKNAPPVDLKSQTAVLPSSSSLQIPIVGGETVGNKELALSEGMQGFQDVIVMEQMLQEMKSSIKELKNLVIEKKAIITAVEKVRASICAAATNLPNQHCFFGNVPITDR
jgi:hypothetical protein